MNDVREALVSLEARMDRRFERIEERFEVRFAGIDRRLDGLDAKFGRLTGVMIAMLIAIIGGLSGVIAAILRH